MEAIRAERKTVVFSGEIKIDGYQMPNGEFRVGVTGASTILGFGKQWLSQVPTNRPKTLKALQGLGYTGSQLVARVTREQVSGASNVHTISLDDFNCLIAYAAMLGKKPAIALQLSLSKIALIDFFRDAFNETPLTIEEKRNIFYQTYASTITSEEWREMDRVEIEQLRLPGDEFSFTSTQSTQ